MGNTPPNELYTVFSFIGFVLCAIPFYWHLEAWNAGTCLYMAWTGLGCLMQCVNSIVWNNNMIDKAPVYCDISIRIQVALNVAIPACSLCITRRLYKIATRKVMMPTGAEKRRAVITDVLIGFGIPILQMVLQYIVSGHRYDLFEDFGPYQTTLTMLPSIFLFWGWPVVVGIVSSIYGGRAVYAFYKRRRQIKEIMASNPGLNRGRYFRLMALSSLDVMATIPISLYYIIHMVTRGLVPWKSWDDTHASYSRVRQFPGFIWKNNPNTAQLLEMYRWSLVLCAFVFFAFFGFAEEARQNYRRVFTSLASRVGYSTSSGTFNASSHANASLPNMERKGGVPVHIVTKSQHRRRSFTSFSDQLSISSTSVGGKLKPDSKNEQYSHSDATGSSSMEDLEPEPQAQSVEPAVAIPAVPPTAVPPHISDTIESTIRTYSSDATDSV